MPIVDISPEGSGVRIPSGGSLSVFDGRVEGSPSVRRVSSLQDTVLMSARADNTLALATAATTFTASQTSTPTMTRSAYMSANEIPNFFSPSTSRSGA